MLAVQHFYAWTEYNTSKLSLTPLLIRATFKSACRKPARRKPAPPNYSKPIQITKSIVIAFVSNLALIDKFAKKSVTIFHADIDPRDVRSVSACSPRSTSRNCEHVYTNLSTAFANFGFGQMPFKRVLASVISALSYMLCKLTPPRSVSVCAKNATTRTRNSAITATTQFDVLMYIVL